MKTLIFARWPNVTRTFKAVGIYGAARRNSIYNSLYVVQQSFSKYILFKVDLTVLLVV